MVDGSTVSPHEIERMQIWPDEWPVMWAKNNTDPGLKRIVVSVPALYWHVKELATRLASDTQALLTAFDLRKRRRVASAKNT
jgi:hypothetical protein